MRPAQILLFVASALAAFAAYTFPTNPVSLGIITVTKAGTPVSLVSSVSAAKDQGVLCRAIELEAIKDVVKTANTGNVFVGASDMNTSTGVGVIKTLIPGEQWSVWATGNALAPDRLFLDAATNGDGAQGRCLVQ